MTNPTHDESVFKHDADVSQHDTDVHQHDFDVRARDQKLLSSKNGDNVKISWSVIFAAILTCIGAAIGYNIAETRAISEKYQSKYEILQTSKLDANIYYEQHRQLQIDINSQLRDIRDGQKDLQKMLVLHMDEKPISRR